MRTDRMRQCLFFLTLTLPCALMSCQDQGAEPKLSYSIINEDHSKPYSFPNGVYYSFIFPEPYGEDFDVDTIFRRVAYAGIRLTDAWYKNYSRVCAPPGSIVVYPAVVEPVLLLRMEGPTSRLTQLGFVEIQNPSTGFCSYRVRRYTFLN